MIQTNRYYRKWTSEHQTIVLSAMIYLSQQRLYEKVMTGHFKFIANWLRNRYTLSQLDTWSFYE